MFEGHIRRHSDSCDLALYSRCVCDAKNRIGPDPESEMLGIFLFGKNFLLGILEKGERKGRRQGKRFPV